MTKERKKLKLGNDSNALNDIKIKDPSVSNEHLEIQWLGKDHILITDLESTNGTTVNGLPIVAKEIYPGDDVKIGQSKRRGSQLIKECNKIWNQNKVIFYDEFKEVENLYNQYLKKQRTIKSSFNLKVNAFRILFIAVLLVLFIFKGESIGLNPQMRILIPIMGGGVASIFADRLFNKENLQLKLRELKENYESRICCPKCSMSLLTRSVKYWKDLRVCPQCHANWVE